MSVLGVVLVALLGVVGLGAYRVYQWLVCHKLDKRVAFVTLTMVAAAMLTPFLLPDNGWLQFAVWILYMCFAGVGACRLYEIIQAFRQSFPRVES
jgi:hypothetical protein